MQKILYLILLLSITESSFCQRLLKGRVSIFGERHAYPGVYICDDSDRSNFTTTDINGVFSIKIPDSTSNIGISTFPTKCLVGVGYQILEVRDSNHLSICYEKEENTKVFKDVSKKLSRKKNQKFKYKLKYDRFDNLKSIYQKSIINKPIDRYDNLKTKYRNLTYNLFKRFDRFEVKLDSTTIIVSHFYFDTRLLRYRNLGEIIYKWDCNGALREKFMNNPYYERTLFFYKNNEIFKCEIYTSFDFFGDMDFFVRPYDINDGLSEIIQNEIIRKELHKIGYIDRFDFDLRFKECK